MSESITAVTTDPTLYSHYSNHKTDIEGIKARHRPRVKWLKMYNKNGSCKSKLIKCGVLKHEQV